MIANTQPREASVHPQKKISFIKRWMLVIHRPKQEGEEVLYGYPNFIYFWPIWILGFLLSVLTHYHVLGLTSAGWIYTIAFLPVMLAMGFDISRNQALTLCICLVAWWLMCIVLKNIEHFMLLSSLAAKFRALDPEYSPRFGIVLSLIMSAIAVMMFAESYVNNRWIISQNAILHRQIGDDDDELGRGAKNFKFRYPNAFKLMLLGAGTVEIRSADGRQVLRIIKNVPFLRFRENRLNQLSQNVSVNSDANAEIAAIEMADDGNPVAHDG